VNEFFVIINVFLIAGVAYQVWRHQSSPLRVTYWPALVCKLTAGVSLGLIYRFYYAGVGDTMLYFSDANILSSFARQDPLGYLGYLWHSQVDLGLTSDAAGQPRTLYLLKLASVFNLLSHDNYWITSAYFSFISFLASWYLVVQVSHTARAAYWPAVVGFLFFPTAVFWSSGLIKESLAMAGLFLLGGCYLRIWFGLRLRYWEIILIPVATWVVWSLKYYFLGVLVPVALASLLVHKASVAGRQAQHLPVKIGVWIVAMLIPLILMFSLHPNFHPRLLMEVIVDNYQAFHRVSDAEDLIFYDELRPEWTSLLFHSPKALLAGLYRPALWEARNVLQGLVAMENAALVLLSIGSFWSLRAFFRSPQRLLVTTVLLYAAILAIFLALSTPNLGTLSRYRVGFLSVLVTVLATNNPLFNRLGRVAQRYLGRLA
jgi:hypothetical protein